MEDREPTCPKHMVFGPCGGVRPSGGCEVEPTRACPFVSRPLPAWPSPPGSGPRVTAPSILTDLHVRPRDATSLRAVARRLRGSCAGVLAGDHAGGRNDFAPSFTAAVLIDEGVRPWITLSCRDRNRVALAAECAALAELGVAGVHCVTGDWQGTTAGQAEAKVFDLDALRLVAMAREHGLTVSVAATPAAPPTDLRPARLVEKVKAGAQLCLVNHAGGPGPVGRFVDRARQLGADVPFVPCVSPLASFSIRQRLGSLPGVVLSSSADWTTQPGDALDAAVDEAAAMLRIDGVEGVNLSGAASQESEVASADAMAELGRRLGAVVGR